MTLRNQFDPRKLQDRQLTNERIYFLIKGIIQNIPSACVLYSIEHTKDNGLPEALPQKALRFMASEEMKGKPLEHTAPLFLKKDAIKAFMSDVASQHEGGLQGFKQCRLFIKPDNPYLASSPDGLFRCKCCGLSTVEAKCPYTVKNHLIFEAYFQEKNIVYQVLQYSSEIGHLSLQSFYARK